MNHQVANEPVVGKEAIKEMFSTEFSQAKMTCIIENILKMASGPFLNGKAL